MKSLNEKNIKISILCPTRDRYDMLIESIDSLNEKAFNKSNIEILIAMDEDDPSLEKHREYIKNSEYDIVCHSTYYQKLLFQ